MKPLITTFIIVLSAVFFLATPTFISAGDKYQDLVNCDLHAGSCTQTLPTGVAVTLEVKPKPIKAMQDLSFTVTLRGNVSATPVVPYIDLCMPGMKMGPNRVQLKPTGNDTYEGRGVIVRCPSGRRIWQASVNLPRAGRTDFIFDVIY